MGLILVVAMILVSVGKPFSNGTAPTSGSNEPPLELPLLSTLLSQDALRDEVVTKGDARERRLRALLRDGLQFTVGNFNPDQHHQCLVSLSDKFGRDYKKSFPIDVAIRGGTGLELRDVDAFLVSDAGSNSEPVVRKITAKLPEIRNHTAIVELDDPKATESLLLVCRVGSEQLSLQGISVNYYGLTLAKQK